jgi:hypothetical protein
MTPEILSLAQRWNFEPTEELPGGHCSKVFANDHLVLKVPFQGEELTYGVPAALKLQTVEGPKVFEHDPGGAVLMERFVPGSTLAESGLEEHQCQEIFAHHARQISTLDPTGAMPLRDFFTNDHPLKRHLLETTPLETFLHGDLHHFNLLKHGESWRPIDPKGLVGDPHFECAAYLRNPIPLIDRMDDLTSFSRSRVLSLARLLDLDPWRIAAWELLDRLEDDESPPGSGWFRLRIAFQILEEELRS